MLNNGYSLHRPTELDGDFIREMAMAFFLESTRSFMPIRREAIDAQIEHGLAEAFSLVGVHNDYAVAFCCFGLDELEFCSVRRLKSRYLYVRPEHRGSPLARMMLREAIAFAAKTGCGEVQVGLSGGINTGRVNRWFQALGFIDLGGILVVQTRHR